ncbi:MAG: hypothetical protein K2M27_06800 [Muribaculaceae bacterium]|nr:hypothetical protein [Muribaculaceae bacterium]
MKLSPLSFVSCFLLAIFYVLGGAGMAAAPSRETERLLEQLDSVIRNNHSIVRAKEEHIGKLRKSLKSASSSNVRLGLCGQLYDEYLVYDSDSALYYAGEARKIVERSMPYDYDLLTEWKLNEAFILTVQGLYDTTMSLLEGIDSSRLCDNTKSRYFGSLAYIYSMRSVYLQSNLDLWKEDMAKANQYRDSIQSLNLPLSPDWAWVPVAVSVDDDSKHLTDAEISFLKETVDSSSDMSRENAINAYWLSRYYEKQGDEDKMMRYKVKAAINDAMIVNREIAAISEIATHLFENGDINRAYNYLIYTVEQVNLYHNRYRIVNLSDVLPTVRDAYREELEKRDRRLSWYVIVLGVLSGILLVSVFFIVFEFVKLRKMRNLLKEANAGLEKSIEERDDAISGLEKANIELAKANVELNEANKQKLGLIAYAFKLTTMCINSLEGYRKKLLKKYKVKKIDDLGVLINDPELVKEQFQWFYEGFDKTVLSIFPNFIEEYNSTVAEGGKVSPESVVKTKTLNTKLRIYALRRLGISKSGEIADMLNVSIRTVYNNRNGGVPEE